MLFICFLGHVYMWSVYVCRIQSRSFSCTRISFKPYNHEQVYSALLTAYLLPLVHCICLMTLIHYCIHIHYTKHVTYINSIYMSYICVLICMCLRSRRFCCSVCRSWSCPSSRRKPLNCWVSEYICVLGQDNLMSNVISIYYTGLYCFLFWIARKASAVAGDLRAALKICQR